MNRIILIFLILIISGCSINEENIKNNVKDIAREVKDQVNSNDVKIEEFKDKIVASTNISTDGIKKVITTLKDDKVVSQIHEFNFKNEEKAKEYYNTIKDNKSFQNLKVEGTKISYELIENQYKDLNKEEIKKELKKSLS